MNTDITTELPHTFLKVVTKKDKKNNVVKEIAFINVRQTTELVPLKTCIYEEFKKGRQLVIKWAGMFAGHQAVKATMYAREKLCNDDNLDFLLRPSKRFEKGSKKGDSMEIFRIVLVPTELDPSNLKEFKDKNGE